MVHLYPNGRPSSYLLQQTCFSQGDNCALTLATAASAVRADRLEPQLRLVGFGFE